MAPRSIDSSEEDDRIVASLIESGRYESADDVVSEALNMLVDHETADDEIKLARLRAEIQIGLDDLDNGRYLEFSSVDGLVKYLSGRTDDLITGRRKR